MPETTHAQFVLGLRELAEFYEAHPEVALPNYPSFNIYAESWRYGTKEAAKEIVVVAARAFGDAKKTYSMSSFELAKEFSGGVKLEVHSDRQTVCTPKVTKVVRRAGYTAPEQYYPPTEEEVVEEWECHSLLKADGGEEPLAEEPLTDDSIPF